MKRLYVLLIICAAWLPLKAQVDVSIQILPPYPTKITDYASRPQLMVISVRNRSGADQKIQLRGAVTGDNGIELRVKGNYKSIQPILLHNNEVRMLNGADLKYFFDYTKIDYKGITQGEFLAKNGLPEGSYRFCIRAYDYDSNAPISSDEPVGCSNTFTISSLEPPTIIAPMADANISAITGQTIVMQWTTPPGTSPSIMSAVRYKIRMVEIFGNKNANNALMSATTPPFFEKVVMGNSYVYNAADPQLTPGRKYALMIEAYDPFNFTPFRNNGRSEVRSFTYTAPAPIVKLLPIKTPPAAGGQHPIIATVPAGAIPGKLDCSCKAVPSVNPSSNATVTTSSVIKVGNYNMHVASLTTGANGLLNGEGTMELPFVGVLPGARLRVTFNDLDVDAKLVMKNGTVNGIISNNAATLIPTADAPDAPNMQMGPAEAGNLQRYFSDGAGKLLSDLTNSQDSRGFELPIGLSKGPVTIAIARITFNASQAWFEAAAAMDLPDGGNDNILGLSGRNMCLGEAAAFCKEGQLYLSQDFNIAALGLKLKRGGSNSPSDPGTSVTFTKDGIQKLTIKAEYTFKPGTLINAAKGDTLVATISGESNPGTTSGWSDWMAKVQIPKFYINGMKSITFDLGGKDMFYDHSDFQRPPGIPAKFSSPDGKGEPINTGDYLWKGFYIPEITVNMPQIIKNTKAANMAGVAIQGSQMIFDSNGFTGSIQTPDDKTILELGDGSMNGWYASIDKIALKFFRSGFKQSSMTGKMVLPASDRTKLQNRINYSADLTTPSDAGIAYSFKLAPADDGLTFDAMLMSVHLDSSSYISVTGGSSATVKAEALLNGTLSISNDPLSKIKVPGMGNLSLPHLEFNNLKFMTTSPFIGNGMVVNLVSGPLDNGNQQGYNFMDPSGDLVAANFAGPHADESVPANVFEGEGGSSQQKLVGFDFTAKASNFVLKASQNGGIGVGLTFTGGVAIGAGPINCQAEANILFSSTISKPGEYVVWDGVSAAIQDISMAAGVDFGPFKMTGAIKYYNNITPADSDEGFVGALQTDLAGFLTLNMRGQFGTKTQNNSNYHYFNFNALADFGQAGITFAPPVPLAIYGFGGGFYYNMNLDPASVPSAAALPHTTKTDDVETLPKAAPANDSDPKDSMKPLDLLAYNPAKLMLHPQEGSWGFNATILFGLTSRNTLDADATFGMGFTSSGGLADIYIDANARFLTNVSEPLSTRNDKSTGVGHMRMEYFVPTKTFHATLDAQFGVPYVKDKKYLYAYGGGEFYSDPDNWYLKIGQPEGYGRGPNHVRLLDFIEGDSYFEVGSNALIDPMPEIPTRVRDLVGYGDHDQQNLLKKSEAAIRGYSVSPNASGGHGVILGSSLKIGKEDEEYKFLMFYGTLDARMGFDLSLRQNVTCSGNPAAGGPGGWYAQGQAYFGAHASLGIDINMFLIKAKFSIFEAGAAAMVRAGLPHPTWVDGAIGGNFSILDGAISADFGFRFNIGDDPCIDAASSPFGGLQIISQVLPATTGEKQPLNSMPAVVFNVKAGGEYPGSSYKSGYFDFDDDVNVTKDGASTKRLFLFDKSCITAKLNGNVVTDKLIRLDADGYSLGYQTTSYLSKNTDYIFSIDARMREGKVLYSDLMNGITTPDYSTYVQDETTHKDASQHMETMFTTDNGFDAIPSTEYAMTAPLHSHKSVPTEEYGGLPGGMMFIETKKVIANESFFTYPAGTTYQVRVFRNGVREGGGDLNVTMETVNNRLNDGTKPFRNSQGNIIHSPSDEHTRWSFKSPVLQKGTDYTVLIIARLPRNNTGTGATPSTIISSQKTMSSQVKVGGQNVDGVEVTALVRKLGNQVNALSSGEAIAGGFNFRTGKYSTYNDKLDGLQISKIHHATAVNNTISTSRMPAQNLQTIKQWKIDTAGMFNINLGSGISGFNFPVDITLTGEQFNKADLYDTKTDDIFQPDYSKYGNGIRTNITVPRLYGGGPQYSYGVNYLKLRKFLSDNCSIQLPSIRVRENSPGKAEDNGIMYCYIRGGISEDYVGTPTNIGAVIPTNLPQVSSAVQTANGGFMIMMPGLTLPTPVLISTFTAANKVCQTRGQATFSDPIQKQIDKVKNWAVNPGDNVASGVGNVMTSGGGNFSNTGVWEGVSVAAGSFLNGGLNQGQLDGAIKGAINKAGNR